MSTCRAIRSPLLDLVDGDLEHLLDAETGFAERFQHWETGRPFSGLWTDEAVLGDVLELPTITMRTVDAADVTTGHTIYRGPVPYIVHQAHPDGEGVTTLTVQRIA